MAIITANLYSLRIRIGEEIFSVYTYGDGRVNATATSGSVIPENDNIEFIVAVDGWITEVIFLFDETPEPSEKTELEAEHKVQQGPGEILFRIQVGSDQQLTGDIIWNRASDLVTAAPRPAFDVTWSDFLYWFRAMTEFLKLIELDKRAI